MPIYGQLAAASHLFSSSPTPQCSVNSEQLRANHATMTTQARNKQYRMWSKKCKYMKVLQLNATISTLRSAPMPLDVLKLYWFITHMWSNLKTRWCPTNLPSQLSWEEITNTVVWWPWPIVPLGELEMLVPAKAASGKKGLNRPQQLSRVIIIRRMKIVIMRSNTFLSFFATLIALHFTLPSPSVGHSAMFWFLWSFEACKIVKIQRAMMAITPPHPRGPHL